MFHPSYRNLKQEQIQIRFNIVVAMAIAQIIFLAGIDASETKAHHKKHVFWSAGTFIFHVKYSQDMLPRK